MMTACSQNLRSVLGEVGRLDEGECTHFLSFSRVYTWRVCR